MGQQPVVLFCKICGTGINLVKGDAVYKCVRCETAPICGKCYNPELKMCVSCATPILKKREQDNLNEYNRRQAEATRKKAIQDEEIQKKSTYCKTNKVCYECGNKGSILSSLYTCSNCKIFLCKACVLKNTRCPACNGSLR